MFCQFQSVHKQRINLRVKYTAFMSYWFVQSYFALMVFITESYCNARYTNRCMTFLLKVLEIKAFYLPQFPLKNTSLLYNIASQWSKIVDIGGTRLALANMSPVMSAGKVL